MGSSPPRIRSGCSASPRRPPDGRSPPAARRTEQDPADPEKTPKGRRAENGRKDEFDGSHGTSLVTCPVYQTLQANPHRGGRFSNGGATQHLGSSRLLYYEI